VVKLHAVVKLKGNFDDSPEMRK